MTRIVKERNKIVDYIWTGFLILSLAGALSYQCPLLKSNKKFSHESSTNYTNYSTNSEICTNNTNSLEQKLK